MPEPTSSAAGIMAAAILVAIGPDSQYALIVFGGLVGVMHSVSRVHTPTKLDAAWYVLKWVLTATLLTGFVTAMLQQHAGLPAERWPGVVAFGITFLSDRWPAWAALMLRARLQALLAADVTREPRK